MEETDKSTISEAAKRRILIVDDEKDFVYSLMDILESRGYCVEAAHSAEEAGAKIGRFDAQVALLDVRLGRSSGIDVIGALKAERPAIICVMMTAYADTETAIQALHGGAYDYLRKPLEAQDLWKRRFRSEAGGGAV